MCCRYKLTAAFAEPQATLASRWASASTGLHASRRNSFARSAACLRTHLQQEPRCRHTHPTNEVEGLLTKAHAKAG